VKVYAPENGEGKVEGKVKQTAAEARLEALAEQLDSLARTRLEMEQLRLLCERARRRERLKREGCRLLRNLAATLREGGGTGEEDSGVLAALAATFPEPLPAPPQPPKRGRPPSEKGGNAKRARLVGRKGGSAGGGGVGMEPVVKVDRECMMTAGQAEAVNDKLPKGYLYVPAEDVAEPSSRP
jgi:hypothetical protein